MDPRGKERFAKLLHHRAAMLEKGEPIAPPLVSATTYHLPETEGASHSYGRVSMPTWEAVETQLGILEDAPCVAFPSGMAAISAALMAVLTDRKRLIIPADGYYVTRVFSADFLAAYGVEVIALPTHEMETADLSGGAVVFLETPSNPGLDCCDIALLAQRVRTAGGLLIVDNTTMTALLQRPLDLGADMVVAADTKAPAGHSDILFGHVATRDAALEERVRNWRKLSGAVPGAFEAWLLHRGIETLEVRLERMCASAQIIAERLAAHPAVSNVRYPGLADDPSHELARRQMSGFGFLIGFEMASEDAAETFLSACPLMTQTTSFGGTHTAGERRARWGDNVAPGFIRLSVGVEPVEPLWTAISAALD
ncbi:cystathionine gamma-lyase (plasmid) [Pseudorhodobacter turbinis]|uniref:Cystathionine gamma-lyase n=1 Tax=Pseudorhodobacter turbinis TaxID=2500533 RepID=A0A4P8EKH9_9RHOB|nr:cystathionine gamma-lyase [Pseudorhodobacter turbinis]QCO57538.1 cystathionine gamma-lyase [Pseudorhodobacter turbinis]